MKILNKIIPAIFLITFALIVGAKAGFNGNMVLADTVLKAGVSLERQVPNTLMGTWRVAAVLKNTDSPQNFKQMSGDIWNLSRNSDVINLSNPFTGASASISVNYVNKNTIRFTKVGDYNNQKLTDSVEITISGDSFTGTNTLCLVTYSEADNSVLSEKRALYVLKGEKISGSDVLGK